jgi:hypothetical protein
LNICHRHCRPISFACEGLNERIRVFSFIDISLAKDFPQVTPCDLQHIKPRKTRTWREQSAKMGLFAKLQTLQNTTYRSRRTSPVAKIVIGKNSFLSFAAMQQAQAAIPPKHSKKTTKAQPKHCANRAQFRRPNPPHNLTQAPAPSRPNPNNCRQKDAPWSSSI